MSDQQQTTNLVNVTINGQTVQTEKGRILIDVAEEMGVFVPRFCYHPGMKSVAVCRMCLVQVEGQRKLLPACATPVDEGMNVNTVDPEAVDAQKGVLELLLINHPLDCPVCDRAGECPLQDQTYRHGPGSSRYVEEKRTYEKALDISELVVLDRERCVLCWRCVRFSDEIAGDRFITLVDRGDGTQILNFADDPFDSYFSGNTIQICPVGALLSKPYRFVSRPWDLQTAPSVCGYCSVGCPVTNEARQGKMARVQALPNEQVNDFWICDKGRFAYHYIESKDRLENPLVRDGEEFRATGWSEAISKIADGLRDKKNIGVLAGGHLTTEDAYAISKLARGVLGTADIDSRIQDAGAPYEAAMRVTGAAGSNATMNDLRAAKTIVWAGPDPKEALPVLYLHLHTTVRDRGARLIVVSPRTTSLDGLASDVIRVAPGGEGDALAALGELEGPVVVGWGPSSPGRNEAPVFDAVLSLAERTGAKVLVCAPHAGSQGLLDMGVHPALEPGYRPAKTVGRDTRTILEAAAAGELDALLIFGADPITDFPDGDLAERALSSGVFTAVVEIFPTETALRADVVLPSAAYAERPGTFTNLERRLQKLEPLLTPPGTAREPWRAAAEIARALDTGWNWRTMDDLWDDLRANVPTHADVDLDKLTQEPPVGNPSAYSSGFAPAERSQPLNIAGPGGQYPKGHRQGAPFQTGQNWPLSWELRAFEAKQRPGFVPTAPEPQTVESTTVEGDSAHAAGEAGEGMTLITGRLIYDGGQMVSRTRALRAVARKPFVEINDEDAKALDIADGDDVTVEGAHGSVTLPARVNGISKGTVFVPFGQEDVPTNKLISGVDPKVTVKKA